MRIACQVLLVEHFMLLYATRATSDLEAFCVFRLYPDTHIVEDFDFGDDMFHPCHLSCRRHRLPAYSRALAAAAAQPAACAVAATSAAGRASAASDPHRFL